MLAEISDIIDRYSISIDCSSVYMYPDIPLKKSLPAIASYAHSITVSDIILLYDDTALGGAKDGFIITKDRFFLKESLERPKSIGSASIKSVDYHSGVMSKKIIINNTKVFSATNLDKKSLEAVAFMMRELYCAGNSQSFQDRDNDVLM